jgi:transposase
LRSGHLTKELLNNGGYNKFLRFQGDVTIEIDDSKIAEAGKWDGLKGPWTNTKISAGEVIENYRQLWRGKQAFRISKNDLRIRQMYRRRRRPMEPHILIAFVAYTIHKELERCLANAKVPLTPARVAELTQTVHEMAVRLPDDPELRPVLLQMEPDQQQIYDQLH